MKSISYSALGVIIVFALPSICAFPPQDVILGEWLNRTTSYEATYATSSNHLEWLADACPVQVTAHSCYFHHDATRADQVRKRTFRLDNHPLSEFDPHVFLSHLRNRKLAFIGDSLSSQHFQIVVCSLHKAAETKYKITWDVPSLLGSKSCVYGSKHCHFTDAWVKYPAYNATIRYHMHHTLRIMQSNYPLLGFHHRDIVVFNSGAHYNGEEVQKRIAVDLSSFLQTHQSLPKTQRPRLIWRESAPTHFPNSSNGYYNGPVTSCASLPNLQKYFYADHRNRITEKLIIEKNITVLRIATPLATQFDAHVQNSFRADGYYDCTHYCFPSGALYFWRDLLHNSLLTPIE